MQPNLCPTKTVNIKLSFCCFGGFCAFAFYKISCRHKIKVEEFFFWPKEASGANICCSKGRKGSEDPCCWVGTHRHRCQPLCRNLMAQSTDVIPEKHTLRWDIFSSLKNTAPNQIIRFHPGILQLVILCNQSSGVSEKKESSAQKKTQVTTKDFFLFFGVLGNQVFFYTDVTLFGGFSSFLTLKK